MSATMTPEAPAAVPVRLMTTEEMLALPDNGMERWLIDGVLRERPMTVRNEEHSGIMANVVYFLEVWRRQQPQPQGRVRCGEAGVELRMNPDCTVGVDVTYVSAEVASRQPRRTTLIDGVPILAVEILSPNEVLEDTEAKINTYLTAGVALVWVINPLRRTVTVYRSGVDPAMFAGTQELSAEPHLPGFRVAVAQLFE